MQFVILRKRFNGIGERFKDTLIWELITRNTRHVIINEKVFRAAVHTFSQVEKFISAFRTVSSCIITCFALFVALQASDKIGNVQESAIRAKQIALLFEIVGVSAVTLI